MTLKNTQELEATRSKLKLLEERIAAIQGAPEPHDHATDLTIRSLKRLANQFKEEIARFEAGVPAKRKRSENDVRRVSSFSSRFSPIDAV